jgi:hypothetical protein
LPAQRIERAACLPFSSKTNRGIENKDDQNRDCLSAIAHQPRDSRRDCQQSDHDARELIDKYTPGGTSLNTLERIETVPPLSLSYFCYCESASGINVE